MQKQTLAGKKKIRCFAWKSLTRTEKLNLKWYFSLLPAQEKIKTNIYTQLDFSQKVCKNKLWPGNKKNTVPLSPLTKEKTSSV